jgi:hypothetical protein
LAVVCLAVAGLVPASAQEAAETTSLSVWPVEIYGCEYREGKGMADLDQATAAFNAWMDARGENDYWAYVLVPHYHSNEIDFDVLWAGGWQSGTAMGRSLERYVNEGGDVAAGFGAVVGCDTVTNFAVLNLTENPDPPAAGPIAFTDCTLEEGKEFPEALAAMKSWVAYENEQGTADEHFILFPAYGESSDADYDFKWVTTSTWEDFGKGWDQYGNGGGWQKSRELFGGLLDCDSSRLYVQRRVREMAAPEAGSM